MSVTVEIAIPPMVDGPQLLDEIETAIGMRPSAVSRRGNTAVLTFDDGSFDLLGLQAAIDAHQPSELSDLDALVAKARNVWAGTDTFTQAQAQKILAGLVLVVARHLR